MNLDDAAVADVLAAIDVEDHTIEAARWIATTLRASEQDEIVARLDRVLADGGLVYRTHGLGYVYVRHASGHTAAVSDEHFLTKNVARHPGMVRHAEFGTTGAQS